MFSVFLVSFDSAERLTPFVLFVLFRPRLPLPGILLLFQVSPNLHTGDVLAPLVEESYIALG